MDEVIPPDEECLSVLELDAEEGEIDPAADNLADQDEENMYGNL